MHVSTVIVISCDSRRGFNVENLLQVIKTSFKKCYFIKIKKYFIYENIDIIYKVTLHLLHKNICYCLNYIFISKQKSTE